MVVARFVSFLYWSHIMHESTYNLESIYAHIGKQNYFFSDLLRQKNETFLKPVKA